MDVKAPSSLEEGVGGGGTTSAVLKQRAKILRNTMTEPERRLWNELRGSRLRGAKFRRQVVIGQRIVDFFCPSKGLVIEIDGDTHDGEVDMVRDNSMLCEHGFATLRFTNEDVMRNVDGVLMHLADALDRTPARWVGRSQHRPQTPSSEEEGA